MVKSLEISMFKNIYNSYDIIGSTNSTRLEFKGMKTIGKLDYFCIK